MGDIIVDKNKFIKFKRIKTGSPNKTEETLNKNITRRRQGVKDKNEILSGQVLTLNTTKHILEKSRAKLKNEYIMVFLFIIIFATLNYSFNNYHRLGLVFKRSIDDKDVVNIDLEDTNIKIIEYKGEILVYNNKSISTYSRNGKKTWEKSLETNFFPLIKTSGKYIQVSNKDNGNIYIYRNKYEVARIKINGSIKSSQITERGNSIIEYSTKGSKTIMGIYNKSGKAIYTIKLNTKTVSDYLLLKNDRYFAFTEVNIDGMSLSTTLKVIDLKSSKEDPYDLPGVVTKENELAYKILFRGDLLHVLFNEGVVSYNIHSKKMRQYSLPQVNLLNVDINSNRYFYVAHNEGEKEYSFIINKFGSKRFKEREILEAPTSFSTINGITYITYLKKISIYNEYGLNIKNYNSDSILTKPVIFNNGKSVAITISNKIIVFTI